MPNFANLFSNGNLIVAERNIVHSKMSTPPVLSKHLTNAYIQLLNVPTTINNWQKIIFIWEQVIVVQESTKYQNYIPNLFMLFNISESQFWFYMINGVKGKISTGKQQYCQNNEIVVKVIYSLFGRVWHCPIYVQFQRFWLQKKKCNIEMIWLYYSNLTMIYTSNEPNHLYIPIKTW